MEEESSTTKDWRDYLLPVIVAAVLGGGGGTLMLLQGGNGEEESDATFRALSTERIHNLTKSVELLQSDFKKLENETQESLKDLSLEIGALREGVNQLLLKEGLDPVRPNGR